jgi:ABC-type glutathione transport system ATPase component
MGEASTAGQDGVMSVIEAEGLSIAIDGRLLLEDVALEVQEASVCALVGGRGAGKTALLKALAGMWPTGAAVSGRVRFGDAILTELAENERRNLRRQSLLYLPAAAKDSLNPVERISRQVIDICAIRPRWQHVASAALINEAKDVFRQLSIADPERVLTSLPDELSGGMNKRVLLAIAILSGARVLLTDEPTAGLDVTIQRQILDLLASLQSTEGFTLVLATQNLGIVAHYCTQVVLLDRGRVQESATPHRFFTEPMSEVGREMVAASKAW